MSAVLSLGVLTDLHLSAPGTPPTRFNGAVRLDRSRELLTEALDWLRPRVTALALLGDLSDAAADADYRYLFDCLDEFGRPTYLVPGNHDLSPGDGTGRSASALDRVLAAVDREDLIVPHDQGVSLPPVRIAATSLHGDRVGFHAGELEPMPTAGGRPLVWLTHFPVLSLRQKTVQNGLSYAGDLANRDRLQASLRRHDGPVVVLAGHLHIRDHTIDHNLLQLDIAALAESPHDATVITVTVDDDVVNVTRSCRPSAHPGDQPHAAVDPAETRFRWNGRRWRYSGPGSGRKMTTIL